MAKHARGKFKDYKYSTKQPSEYIFNLYISSWILETVAPENLSIFTGTTVIFTIILKST